MPTYASIGILAPILLILLRIIQGIGLGGEWGGASLMVLEHAPIDKRGFYTSFVQIGFPIGLVLATLVFSLVTKFSDADIQAYGWRIPFLISILLLAIGTFVRSRVPETPVFEGLKMRDGLSSNPFTEAVGKNTKSFLIAVGLKLSEVSWVYMLTVFVVVYATTKLGIPKPMMLNAVLYAALLELITLPLFGWISDKIGRRPLFIARRAVHDRVRVPAVLDAGKQEHRGDLHRHDDRDEFRSRPDVRLRILLLPGIVRPAGALQRCDLRISALGGDRRRLCADHRDRDGRLYRRHHRRVDHDDHSRAHYAGRRTGGA